MTFTVPRGATEEFPDFPPQNKIPVNQVRPMDRLLANEEQVAPLRMLGGLMLQGGADPGQSMTPGWLGQPRERGGQLGQAFQAQNANAVKCASTPP